MFVRARRLPVPMLALALCGLSLAGWEARASLPRWMQDAIGSSAIEAALYRTMEIPGVKALYARPPKEAEVELGAVCCWEFCTGAGSGALCWRYQVRPKKAMTKTTVISSMERASKPPPGF